MKVTIYALIDPITCRVRYIGRTKVSIKARLSQHIHRAKYGKEKTHKRDWILSLLKINCKPLVRKLTEVEGWNESYILEQNLIKKYEHRLTNFYDKGPGSLRTFREEDKIKISESLKRGYKNGTIKKPSGKTIYVYKRDGTFYDEFISIQEVVDKLGVYRTTIKKHIKGLNSTNTLPKKKKFLKSKYQYNTVKVEKMHDYTR